MRPLAFGLLVREAHRSANGWRAARHRPGKPVSGATSRSGCYLRCRCQGQGPPWEPRRRRCLSFLGPPPAPPCGCCPGCSPVGRPRGPLPIRGRTRFAAGYFSCSNAGPGQPVGSAVALAVRAAVHTARSLPALVPPDWLPCSPAPAHRAESRLLLLLLRPLRCGSCCCCCCCCCDSPPHTATNRSLARLVHLRTPARPVPPFPLPYVAVPFLSLSLSTPPVSSSNAPSALMPRSCPSRRAKSPLLRWRRKIPPAAERARPR